MKQKISLPVSNPMSNMSDEEMIRLLLIDRSCRYSIDNPRRATNIHLDYFLKSLLEGEKSQHTYQFWSNESLAELYLIGIVTSSFHYFLYVSSRDRVAKLSFECT